MLPPIVQSIVVLGGGSAGFMAALTLKRRLPHLAVTVLRSPEIGIIGVGEGTTAVFPRHFFDYLKLKPKQFYAEAQPTWKLGIKFLWGTRDHFHYTFASEHRAKLPHLARNNGFYCDDETICTGEVSALMEQGRVFGRGPGGQPHLHPHHAYHIENHRLVGWLENVSRSLGVNVRDVTVRAEAGAGGVAALIAEDGERFTANLFVDASGFRSELLGRTLDEPFISYEDALFCDRAVIGGWTRTTEPILPYTVAETMDAGWCWQIEHEHWLNRGYVYSSAFISDEAALAEFLRKNPRVSNEPRVVRFRSGRRGRNWIGNVVGVGNSVGFVEPLEATALQIISIEATTLADSLAECACVPTPTLLEVYNRWNTQAWDDIRDFLAVHYKFNDRLDTPFWRACRADTQLHGAQFIVDYYRENGPGILAGQFLHPSNSFGIDGYLAMLVGQRVPCERPFAPPSEERKIWHRQREKWLADASRALDVKQCLEAIRRPNMKWA